VDLSDAAWRTSTYSGGNGGQCVQVAAIPARHGRPDPVCAVRDSKNRRGPVLTFGPRQWQQFITEIKAQALSRR
jgi:hypothetical protein